MQQKQEMELEYMTLNQSEISLRVSLFIAVLLLLNSCRVQPIYNAKNVPISPKISASEKDIAEAIWSAGRRFGWETEKIEKWKIKAVKNVRRHSLTVMIIFNKTAFDITYVDSKDLKYDGESIHAMYNVWVRELEEMIQKEIEYRLPETR